VRVAIVEPGDAARNFVARMFREAGFDVACFATTPAALAWAASHAPDLVVTGVASLVTRVGGDAVTRLLAAPPPARGPLQAALAERVREAGVGLLLADVGAEPFSAARLIAGASRLAARPAAH
jgi:CheY-like chemotaxis protein